MRFYYNETEMADFLPLEAVYTDRTGKADSLELTFGFGERWMRWGAAAGDRVRIVQGGCDTGTMYVTAAENEDGTYKILATAAKPKCRVKGNCCYSGAISAIGAAAAAQGDMGFAMWGTDDMAFSGIVRSGETPGEFLNKLAGYAGAKMKTFHGMMRMIGLRKAQELAAAETLVLRAEQRGVRYLRRFDLGTGKLTLGWQGGLVNAWDDTQTPGPGSTAAGTPAGDMAQAAAIARNLMLLAAAGREELTIETDFRQSWTAMGRIDTLGPGALEGKWILEEVRQDLKNGRTRGRMVRVED